MEITEKTIENLEVIELIRKKNYLNLSTDLTN